LSSLVDLRETDTLTKSRRTPEDMASYWRKEGTPPPGSFAREKKKKNDKRGEGTLLLTSRGKSTEILHQDVIRTGSGGGKTGKTNFGSRKKPAAVVEKRGDLLRKSRTRGGEGKGLLSPRRDTC